MRLAILILWVACMAFSAARADESFIKVTVDGHVGYIVPETNAQKTNSLVSFQLKGSRIAYRQLTGFWTPSVAEASEAERRVRKFIREGRADPKSAFPDLAAHPDKFVRGALQLSGREVELIDKDYDKYVRQFVGIRMGNEKFIWCSYFFAKSVAPLNLDPAKDFLVIFDGGHTVWQIEYDPRSKDCLNLDINGPFEGGP